MTWASRSRALGCKVLGLKRSHIPGSEPSPEDAALAHELFGSSQLHEMLGPENQWAITWTQMQVFTVGLQNFGGQDDAQWCHESFMADWRDRNKG